MKKDLILRNYQIPASDYIMNSEMCVLVICPNGGKTEVSIRIIERYLKENPNARILILTHSTNVLLDNYVNRLNSTNVSFEYTTEFKKDINVHICLPQNRRKIFGTYDFLIVDEAHENYLAPRVQGIIEQVKPTKQLLLTGTPSKFIKEGGYDCYYVAANEISNEYFSKLNVELVASNYEWVGHYNSLHEVKEEFVFELEQTKKTLENVIGKLIERLKKEFSPEQFNHPSFFTKLKSWAFTYKSIGKTLIVCKTIEQANMVYEILKNNDVSCGMSHSDCDVESEVIRTFKRNEIELLVVVNRARLGYNDEDLKNIIDISGTHNPDIIYQMMMRAARGNPNMQKYYLKLTPKQLHNMSLTHISVAVALMLTDKKYLSTYNGANFNGLEIPVLKENERSVKTGDGDGDGEATRDYRKKNYLPEIMHDVIDSFKNVLHNLDNPASIYKMTTIAEAKIILGHKSRIKYTREMIFASAAGEKI